MRGARPGTSEAEILARVVRPDDSSLPEEAARAFLKMGFDAHDRARMHELAVKNQEEALTEKEHEELENYRRVARLLDLLASKARRSLKRLGVDV